ncbi:ROK family protein [Leucobacter insecticola]|uniref:ROK family protein n=1 Tax=Leucobacter insecticola TaxID=2714934 RepID=A0A6G8FHJ3_9MICO|nr:ROK family protein [Leucobacter insecticola]QIM15835.1 ROK family protein [Leucobacter insecticola]
MTPEPCARIGIDIGGTSTEALMLNDRGSIEAEVQLDTEPGIEAVLDTVERAVAILSERSGRSLSDFVSLGIGIPGQVDHERGIVRHAYNIGVDELALASAVQGRIGIPVSLDNDVTAAAIGAAQLMQLDGSVAYLNLGTGIAAGFVIDGQPMRGAHGVTGEIGHLAIDPRGRACPCGQRGCLETVASGSALRSFWRADANGRLLMSELAAGDPGAEDAFEALVTGAATAVRLLVLTLDPHTVVIGGGLRMLGAPLLDGIRDTLDAWAAASPFLANLNMSARILPLPANSPAAAVGAALSYRG